KYFFNSSDGETTQNQFSAELEHDWLNPDSPWFYFASGRYEYDEFQNWKSRISAYGGVGYTFIKTKELEVLGRAGFGATKNLGGNHDLIPEAMLGASVVKWHITPNQTLALSNTIYPALSHLGRFRDLFDAS